jgi:flagellar transcriptional activator FlhD
MMRNSQTLDSIRELNLSYLLLAQRLLVEDRAGAQARLGLSEEMADTMAKLTPAQTDKLASSSQVLCFFRMGGDALLAGLAGLAERVQDAASSASVSNAALLAA